MQTVAVCESNQRVDRICDMTEAPGLQAISVNGELLAE